MLQWLMNFVQHPSSTLSGMAGGGALVAFLSYMSTELHCDWSLFSLQSAVAFLIPFIVGGGAGSTAKPTASPAVVKSVL